MPHCADRALVVFLASNLEAFLLRHRIGKRTRWAVGDMRKECFHIMTGEETKT